MTSWLIGNHAVKLMEMETIGKKVAPEAKVNMDRRCENCACFNGKDWCKLHQHSTRAINYGCKTHLTKEEMDVKIKNAQEYLEAQDGSA